MKLSANVMIALSTAMISIQSVLQFQDELPFYAKLGLTVAVSTIQGILAQVGFNRLPSGTPLNQLPIDLKQVEKDAVGNK